MTGSSAAATVHAERDPAQMSVGIPGLDANRFAAAAGMDDGEHGIYPSLHCTMPSPPHTETSSAPAWSASRTRLGAIFDFGTSNQQIHDARRCQLVMLRCAVRDRVYVAL